MADLPISAIIGTDTKVFHRGVGTSLSALLPPPPLRDSGFLLGAPWPFWAVLGLLRKALVYFVFLEIGVLSKADRLILPYQERSATVNGFL